jgi:hypothetical protein
MTTKQFAAGVRLFGVSRKQIQGREQRTLAVDRGVRA